jgi:putative ABC transport system ATP-binding protein
MLQTPSANDPQIMLHVQALSKQVSLPERTLTLLDQVSFTLLAGETLAITGASGSGKSTLLGLLAGLDSPSSGSVQLAGTDLNLLNEDGRAKLRRQQVGFVFQSFQLLPALSALENVMLPLELMGEPNAKVKAQEILGQVGLSERLTHYPRQLSGGEQQRVAIARAFVGTPKLLFADEPTGNLDTSTGQQIADLLFALNQSAGTTLVLVTHDQKLANRCQRILKLDAGRVVNS